VLCLALQRKKQKQKQTNKPEKINKPEIKPNHEHV